MDDLAPRRRQLRARLAIAWRRAPPGFRLARSYARSPAHHALQFDAAGRFATGDGAATGSYDITGYTLALRFDDGAAVDRMIVLDPRDPRVLYIDDHSFSS